MWINMLLCDLPESFLLYVFVYVSFVFPRVHFTHSLSLDPPLPLPSPPRFHTITLPHHCVSRKFDLYALNMYQWIKWQVYLNNVFFSSSVCVNVCVQEAAICVGIRNGHPKTMSSVKVILTMSNADNWHWDRQPDRGELTKWFKF